MADTKKDGYLGVLSDWWNAPVRPAEHAEVPAVDPRTLNRRAPSKPMTGVEGVTNALHELQQSHFGADYLRDLVKGGYKAGSHFLAHPRADLSAAWQGLTDAGHSLSQITAAHEYERTGRWPDTTAQRFLAPEAYKKWQADAVRKYRSVASTYSYVDPQTGQRQMDWDALFRGASKDPVGTVAPILTEGGSLIGKTGAAVEGLTGLSAAGTTGRAIRRGTRIAATALDPAGAVTTKAISAAVPPVARAVKIASWRSALGPQGGFTTPAWEALVRAGFDPHTYNTPELRSSIAAILDRKRDLSAPVVREAVASAMNVPVTRSMTLQARAPIDLAASVAQERARANAAINSRRANAPQVSVPSPTSTDLGGVVHSFDDATGQWIDPNGRAVTAPGKVQFLHANRGTTLATDPMERQRLADVSGIVNDTSMGVSPVQGNVLSNFGRHFSFPAMGASAGHYLGSQFGGPTGSWLGSMAGLGVGTAADRAMEAAAALRRERAEFSGAPIDRMAAPDLFRPYIAGQAAAGTQGPVAISAATPKQQPQPQRAMPTAAPQDPYGLPANFEEPKAAPVQQAKPKAPVDPFGIPAGFEESKQDPYATPEGFMYGGRTAYKSGGKVSSGIEPLVQNLMSGYKKAKAAETATTKPLLQHSDQTIVRALRVAKKAI